MYKANKPCRFGGRQFYIGDTIPDELIDPQRAKTLAKYGTIAIGPEEAPSAPQEDTRTAPQDDTGTIAGADKENASEGVKQPFNTAKSTPAPKQVRKGGK